MLLAEAANNSRKAQFCLFNDLVASGYFMPELFVGCLQLGELLLEALLGLFVFGDFLLELFN
ncbi:MAG: hypothetical protein A2Z38_06865 [Planctomycetes bacterium RBG_19FT_COMBO_48_8]|nr:MAG: hypothetical protein A2Z38_06865 [Planctomycetes bacterium RBG_19FT_COMBO_48_8]